MVTDEQIATALYPPQTLAGELLVHGALDVLIQKLIADVHSLVIDPLVGFVGAKVCRTIVVELHRWANAATPKHISNVIICFILLSWSCAAAFPGVLTCVKCKSVTTQAFPDLKGVGHDITAAFRLVRVKSPTRRVQRIQRGGHICRRHAAVVFRDRFAVPGSDLIANLSVVVYR